jgi:photosystem II stability/assembly factor-like uncharacterized protein
MIHFPRRTKLTSILLATLAAGACNDSDPGKPRMHVRPPGEFVETVATESLTREVTFRHAKQAPGLLPIGGSLWKAVGPAAITGGQVENVAPENKVAGAVHVTIPHPTNADRMWIATVNGGIWETHNARAQNPTWRPLTDRLPSLSTAALDLDPTDTSYRTLLAGLGNASSYGQSASLNGLLYTRNNGLTWKQLEDPLLEGRSVMAVAARGNVLLAATTSFFGSFPAGGVMRSTDHGQTWSLVAGIPAGVDSFDIAGDPANPARLYVATNVGIFRTNDTGATWTNISSGDPAITRLLTDRGLSLCELDVGAQGRLFTTITRYGNGAYIGYTDGGAWTAMDLPYTPESDETPIAAVVPSNYGVLVTSPGHQLENGSLVEVEGFQGMTGVQGVYIAIVANANAFHLYEAQGVGAYTGGGTWQLVNGTNPKSKSNGVPGPFGAGVRRPGGQGYIHLSIAADPTDRNIVYIGGDRQGLAFNAPVLNFLGAEDYSGRLFRGNTAVAPTGGILSPQWAHLTHRNDIAEWANGGTASTSAPHADSRDMEFDANGDLIEADDGGIYRRTSPRTNTGDWFALVGNLHITEAHNIAYDRVSKTVIAGTQDVGTPMSTPGSLVWTSYTTGDGADVSVDDTTLAAEGRSIRYTGFPGYPAYIRSTWDATGTLVTEEATSMSPLDGIYVIGTFTTPVELNTIAPTRLVVGGQNGVFESLDQGETTTRVGPGIESFTNAMAYGGSKNGTANPDVLYYGAANVVYRRAQAGTLATATATPFPGGEVRDIALAPRDHDTAFVVGPTSVHVTRDAGASWKDLTGNLEDASLRSIVIVELPLGIHAVIVGGLTGVSFTWLFPNQTIDPVWFELGSNLPAAPVWDLDWDGTDRVLTVGTLGRGAWQAKFF